MHTPCISLQFRRCQPFIKNLERLTFTNPRIMLKNPNLSDLWIVMWLYVVSRFHKLHPYKRPYVRFSVPSTKFTWFGIRLRMSMAKLNRKAIQKPKTLIYTYLVTTIPEAIKTWKWVRSNISCKHLEHWWTDGWMDYGETTTYKYMDGRQSATFAVSLFV